MDGMDEPRSPSLPTSPAAPIIVFPSPSTLSSSSFSGQYGVQKNRGQLNLRQCLRLMKQDRHVEKPATAAPGGPETRGLRIGSPFCEKSTSASKASPVM